MLNGLVGKWAGKKMYLCDFCDISFSTQDDRDLHVCSPINRLRKLWNSFVKRSEVDWNYPLSCSLCASKFMTLEDWKAHPCIDLPNKYPQSNTARVRVAHLN